MEILKQRELPLYSLYIKQKDLRALNRDIWSDGPVPALFHYEDKKYKIDILYRGGHTKTFPRFISTDWLPFSRYKTYNYDLYRKNGLFEMIPWNYDATWGRDVNGIDMPYDYVPKTLN